MEPDRAHYSVFNADQRSKRAQATGSTRSYEWHPMDSAHRCTLEGSAAAVSAVPDPARVKRVVT
jgi:hypothetical protein